MADSRYAGFAFESGLMVLDTETGAVFRVEYEDAPKIVPGEATLGGTPRSVEGFPSPPSPAAVPLKSALDSEVLASYPYPIALAWQAYLIESEPRQRCKLMVDAFTMILKQWALLTAGEYLACSGANDAATNQLLLRDFQRPLLSTWNLMLFRGLPVLQREGETFAPELHEVYATLESRCQDKVTLEKPYFDKEGKRRVRKTRLGKIQALLNYRNGLMHGFHQSVEQATADLSRFEPIVREIVAAARFLTRYPLYEQLGRDGQSSRVRRMMGVRPDSIEEKLDADLVGEHRYFLYCPQRRRVLAMPVLFSSAPFEEHEEEALLLFEGCTKSTVLYQSVHGHTIGKQGAIEPWHTLLECKAPTADAKKRGRVELASLRNAAEKQTRAALEERIQTGKYLAEASPLRRDVARIFEEFSQGDFRALVLGGETGVGKSTALTQYVERACEAGDVVLYYRGADLTGEGLSQRILADLRLPELFFEDFLERADQAVFDEQRRMHVVIDGIAARSEEAAALVRAIDGVVRQADNYPWFRLLTSVRDAAYRRLPKDARFGSAQHCKYLTVEDGPVRRSPVVRLPPLSDEDLSDIFEAYRNYRTVDPSSPEDEGSYLHRPQTGLEELSWTGSTIELMRNPQMLRLLMVSFNRQPLTSELSVHQAMRWFVDHVVVERDNHHGDFRERLVFLRKLVAEMDRANSHTLTRDSLYEIPALAAVIRETRQDSPYLQLLDLGVLAEEWKGYECRVRVSFDGLFEFLLSERIYPQIESSSHLMAQLERAEDFVKLRGAVGQTIIRSSGDGNHALVVNCLASLPPSNKELEAVAVEVVGNALAMMVRTQDPSLTKLLASLKKSPSIAAVNALVHALDESAGNRGAKDVEELATVALALAEAMDSPDLQASVLLRIALLRETSGDGEAALDRLTEARRMAVAAGNPSLEHSIDLRRGIHLAKRSELAEADKLLARSFDGFKALECKFEAATARRWQGVVAEYGGDLVKSLQLTEESLVLAEESGERLAAAQGLNSLALVHAKLGNTDMAEDYYRKSLAQKEALGNRRSVAVTHLNMGSFFNNKTQDSEKAKEHWQRALKLFCDLGDAEGEALCLMSMGSLELLVGRHRSAHEHLLQALKIFEKLGHRQGLAYSEWYLANVALDEGDVVTGQKHTEKFRGLPSGPETPLYLAALELRLACASKDGRAIESSFEVVEQLTGSARADDVAVEDSPLAALLDAANFWRQSGSAQHAERARTLASPLLVDPRFHRCDELGAPAKGESVQVL